MKRTKWIWVLLLVELCIVFFIGYQLHGAFPKSYSLDRLNDNFGISISTEEMNCLYEKDTQNWVGKGVVYSVWQCQDNASIVTWAKNWEKGKVFQFPLFSYVQENAELQVNVSYLPRNLMQEGNYYQMKDGDKQVFLIFILDGMLEDGLHYRNLLFVVEQYN